MAHSHGFVTKTCDLPAAFSIKKMRTRALFEDTSEGCADPAPFEFDVFAHGMVAAGGEASPVGTGAAALDCFAIATAIVAAAVAAVAAAVGKMVLPVADGIAAVGLVEAAVGGVLKAVALDAFLS